MYSEYLQEYLKRLGEYALVPPGTISLLSQAVKGLVNILGRSMNTTVVPEVDLLDVSVRLLLLSDGLASLPLTERLRGAHYLVGLGLEQTGSLLTRLFDEEVVEEPNPFENDLWCTLTLAFLHYLAGGYRVQALATRRQLERVSGRVRDRYPNVTEYEDAVDALRRIYAGRNVNSDSLTQASVWHSLLFDQVEAEDPLKLRLQRLARKIRERRDVVLANLGEGNEAFWLLDRGIEAEKRLFWQGYLRSLDARGITAFTQEQVGENGFDDWLRLNSDLLVMLPTGAGKTIIGELRSALALASEKQVVWMLPTRALVRQVKRDLRDAFGALRVTVEELPTTEDFIPLFAESLGSHLRIAVTTPEKMASLLRSNPESVANVGLVVFDEAQVLMKEDRGTTAEYVLRQIRHRVPECDMVLMSASLDIRTSLEEFLEKLGRQPRLLTSNRRPTRRIYGVITNSTIGEGEYVSALLYPPGIQEERGYTENPIRITFDEHRKLPSRISPTDMAQRFARQTMRAGLRTVLFVSRRDSTETQANKIARVQRTRLRLPEQDIARLHVELGGTSVLEESGSRGVVPHHAGLTPLEQVLAEKWVREGIVSTVVATPTLAQGVNLPFDFSVVTYVTRGTQTGMRVAISPREIQNMLGRAGRAGYVSDGFGLLSLKRSPDNTERQVLDGSRRFFFQTEELSDEYLGLSRLIQKAMRAEVDDPEWLFELDELSFSEVQSLTGFVLRAAAEEEVDVERNILAAMMIFPSIQQSEELDVEKAASMLGGFVRNLKRQAEDSDSTLTASLERTGLPTEVLSFFLSELETLDPTVSGDGLSQDEIALWADLTVQEGIERCSSRRWYENLVRGVELERMFSTINLWRSGAPFKELEANWQVQERSEKRNRIELGAFINHRLSLFAQFWGALAVCYEERFSPLRGDRFGLTLQRLPSFIREGVMSLDQLHWLYAIGGLDRVLVHRLTSLDALPISRSAIRSWVREWRLGRQRLPGALREEERIALSGAIGLVNVHAA